MHFFPVVEHLLKSNLIPWLPLWYLQPLLELYIMSMVTKCFWRSPLSGFWRSPFPGFGGVRVAQFSIIFCVLFCQSLFIFLLIFFLAILLSVLLRFTASDYPFGIFKFLFFNFKRYLHVLQNILTASDNSFI